MPEQLTKHPEVTLQVLRSGGARCGEGLAPQILTQCPAERFCQLPGGELCVYGLPEAARMTQITAADWRTALPMCAQPPAPRPSQAGGAEVGWALVLGLVFGTGIGMAVGRRKRRPRP